MYTILSIKVYCGMQVAVYSALSIVPSWYFLQILYWYPLFECIKSSYLLQIEPSRKQHKTHLIVAVVLSLAKD